MFFSCPTCQMSLQAEPEWVGRIVNCPGCGARIQVPSLTESRGATGASGPKRGGWEESDPSNVNPWLGLGIGMGAMVVTLLLLLVVEKSFVGQVYWTGGWVNHAEFVLFFWGLGIVFLKWRKTRRQGDALLLDVLPKRFGDRISAANVSVFIDQLYKLPPHLRDSMMVNHIRKGLELFESRGNNAEVESLLNSQSAIDANRIASSYALLKVFLWAIPILGFIGTVLGLSFAMASFGTTDLTDMGSLKTAVSSITSGLATAFNTTLLGLILSILLIFPMSTIQKLEEDCLNDIDAFCNEVLLARLDDGGGGATGGSHDSALVERLVEGITGSQREFIERFAETTELCRTLAEHLENRALAHQGKVEDSFLTAMNVLTARTTSAMEETVRTAGEYMKGLEKGLGGLNDVLEQLGQKTVVVQQVEKRRWWPFGRRS